MPYDITTITQFKGLSQTLALTSGDPAFATDLVNVIPSVSGIAKLRIPTTVSSPAVGGNGPDQFAMYEGNSSRSVLGFFGQEIYVFSLDDFVPTIFDSNPDYLGPAPWSVINSNGYAFLQNGSSLPLKWNGSALALWGIQTGGVPTLGTPAGTGITLAIGRKYRAAYGSDAGAVGTASAPSADTGTIANQYIPVTIPVPPAGAETQITKARLYATLDGGSDYFFHSVVNGPFPQTINDSTPDADLDQSERAPLINDAPPIAKYTCLWGSRIFMFNLLNESTKWVAYTGYNRIFVGAEHPEETCPPGNRIKLDIGADEIAGGGVIESGVVCFDQSSKMFMFRGQPEDITVDAPVEFSLYFQQLPWSIGCAGHFTIQSTKRGLVWLTSDLDVMVFTGKQEPTRISEGVEPILRTVSTSAMANARSAYWTYKGRNWYVLGVPTSSASPQDLTKLLIFDLEESMEKNVGTFVFDVGAFQSIGIVEMSSREQKLLIGQDGLLKELKVTPTTINGIEESLASSNPDESLGAYWRSGRFGNGSPMTVRQFRYGQLVADQPGIRVKRYLYREDITAPEPIEFVDTYVGGKITTNRKGKGLVYELRFRDEDVAQNILQFTDVSIPVSVR